MKVTDNRSRPVGEVEPGSVVETPHGEFEAPTPHIVTALTSGGATLLVTPSMDREPVFDEAVLIHLETGKVKVLPRSAVVQVIPARVELGFE